MAEIPFWFHPDASAEALAIHNHYFNVAHLLQKTSRSNWNVLDPLVLAAQEHGRNTYTELNVT